MHSMKHIEEDASWLSLSTCVDCQSDRMMMMMMVVVVVMSTES